MKLILKTSTIFYQECSFICDHSRAVKTIFKTQWRDLMKIQFVGWNQHMCTMCGTQKPLIEEKSEQISAGEGGANSARVCRLFYPTRHIKPFVQTFNSAEVKHSQPLFTTSALVRCNSHSDGVALEDDDMRWGIWDGSGSSEPPKRKGVWAKWRIFVIHILGLSARLSHFLRCAIVFFCNQVNVVGKKN